MKDHRMALSKILNTYSAGPGLMEALNTYCNTQLEMGERDAIKKQASDVCEGLHITPAKTLKCRQCYEAEQNFSETEKVLAEWDRAKGDEKP